MLPQKRKQNANKKAKMIRAMTGTNLATNGNGKKYKMTKAG